MSSYHMSMLGFEPTESGVYRQLNGKWMAHYIYESGATASHPGIETEALAQVQLDQVRHQVDGYWKQKIRWRQNGDRTGAPGRPFRDVIRADGIHYTIGHMGVVAPSRLDMFGFGGQTFRWRWLDDPEGTVHESNNLWFQGPIPEGLRGDLPDNAVFLDAAGKEIRR